MHLNIKKDTVKNKDLCGFDRKARAIFTSSGNSIEVYFVIGKPSKTTKDYQEPAFIVTYNGKLSILKTFNLKFISCVKPTSLTNQSFEFG